jgi:hypothetical protein
MTIDLDAIEAAARGATPGPWEKFENEGWHVAGICTVFGGERDTKYIATMDPQTTLALVERVRELEATEFRLRQMIEDYRFLHRSYAQSGDLVRAEMYAERIAQIETAMGSADEP